MFNRDIRRAMVATLAIILSVWAVDAWSETRAIATRHSEANYGVNIAVPFYATLGNPTATSEWYVPVHKTLDTLGFHCVSAGAVAPTALIIKIQECDANAANCADSGYQVQLDANETLYEDTTATDSQFDEGDWLKFDVVSAVAGGTRVYCYVDYIYTVRFP